MSYVIIMRGMPGSSKSYTANKLIESFPPNTSYVICSADHFFINPDGFYNFDINKLGFAHGACKAKFIKALDDEVNNIIIDNTNTTYHELKEYIEYAAMAGAEISLLEAQAPWSKNVQECFKRNTHKVPLQTLEKMAVRYQSNEEIAKLCLEELGVEIKY